MLFELIERNQVEVLLHRKLQGLLNTKKGKLNMKDAFGNELSVGDDVIYIQKVGGSGGSVCLAKGVVHSLTKRLATIRVPDKDMRCGYDEFNMKTK